jgi:hypothetical protein
LEVTAAAFRPRDEELARIERWLADLLASSQKLGVTAR